jgi:hypothetical protein
MVLKGLKSGQSVAEAETTISYQKVGNLLMPEKINSYDKYSEGNGTIESRGETLFKNCVVN